MYYLAISIDENKMKLFKHKENADSYCRNRKAYVKEIELEDDFCEESRNDRYK